MSGERKAKKGQVDDAKFLKAIDFYVPYLPPSTNHYKQPYMVKGPKPYIGWYVTDEAVDFKGAVAMCARGQMVEAETYKVTLRIVLGPGDRGDVDNFAKVCLDGLVDAQVIHSDAAIMELLMIKQRGEKAATYFTVEAL